MLSTDLRILSLQNNHEILTHFNTIVYYKKITYRNKLNILTNLLTSFGIYRDRQNSCFGVIFYTLDLVSKKYCVQIFVFILSRDKNTKLTPN